MPQSEACWLGHWSSARLLNKLGLDMCRLACAVDTVGCVFAELAQGVKARAWFAPPSRSFGSFKQMQFEQFA